MISLWYLTILKILNLCTSISCSTHFMQKVKHIKEVEANNQLFFLDLYINKTTEADDFQTLQKANTQNSRLNGTTV